MRLNKAALDLLRAKNCITVKELARKAEISQPTINNGYKRDIDPLPIGKLARALNVRVEDIIIQEED